MLSHVFISRLLLTEVDNGFYSLYNGSYMEGEDGVVE